MQKILSAIALTTLLLSGSQVSVADSVHSNLPASGMSAGGNSLNHLPPMTSSNKTAKAKFKILTDYPGRVRQVTPQQKAEIKAFLGANQGQTKFICTGIRLDGQAQGMNLAVRLRAKLVCEYAKTLQPDLSFWYQTKITKAARYNGHVMVTGR